MFNPIKAFNLWRETLHVKREVREALADYNIYEVGFKAAGRPGGGRALLVDLSHYDHMGPTRLAEYFERIAAPHSTDNVQVICANGAMAKREVLACHSN